MSLFQSNLRKQIRKLPEILKSVKITHYYSLLFICVLRPELRRPCARRLRPRRRGPRRRAPRPPRRWGRRGRPRPGHLGLPKARKRFAILRLMYKACALISSGIFSISNFKVPKAVSSNFTRGGKLPSNCVQNFSRSSHNFRYFDETDITIIRKATILRNIIGISYKLAANLRQNLLKYRALHYLQLVTSSGGSATAAPKSLGAGARRGVASRFSRTRARGVAARVDSGALSEGVPARGGAHGSGEAGGGPRGSRPRCGLQLSSSRARPSAGYPGAASPRREARRFAGSGLS